MLVCDKRKYIEVENGCGHSTNCDIVLALKCVYVISIGISICRLTATSVTHSVALELFTGFDAQKWSGHS